MEVVGIREMDDLGKLVVIFSLEQGLVGRVVIGVIV